MYIVIDQGNTILKIGLFEGKAVIKTFQTKEVKQEWFYSILKTYQPQAGILCSTREVSESLLSLLRESLSYFYEFKNNLPLPLSIDYQTPRTLGTDRLAAAVGAWYQKLNNNLLIIDIGTAITIDFVNRKGIYKGGNISLGPAMRLNALHYFTNSLPLISENGNIPIRGYDTETAIRSGVMEGIVHELGSYIEEYEKKENALTFLTGGNTIYFEKRLKGTLFVDKHLVLKGLNEILIYQKKIFKSK
ncbi:MAG: type III pantothenate kinase [Candidatus Azobacteroides pseudotrichonymphae]|jgi:type III pantothenate kinase|nr:MAG: type III pantothenate kinase [Candidatus Azobacteroides pseudotrichonymphae]